MKNYSKYGPRHMDNVKNKASGITSHTDKKVAVVIVNYCGYLDTIACLESLLQSFQKPQWIIIVDNASPDNSKERLISWATGEYTPTYPTWPDLDKKPTPKPIPLHLIPEGKYPKKVFSVSDNNPHLLLLCKDTNTGYAGGNNAGLTLGLHLGADTFWILNNDVIVHPYACTALVRRTFSAEKTGMVGCCVRYLEDPEIVQCCAGAKTNKWTLHASMIGDGMNIAQAMSMTTGEVESNLNYVYGASFMITRSFLGTIGLMDERYFMYYEELDWALRSQEFYLRYAPDAHVLHKGGASTSKSANKKRLLWVSKSRLRLTAKFFPHYLPVVFTGLVFDAGRVFAKTFKRTIKNLR